MPDFQNVNTIVCVHAGDTEWRTTPLSLRPCCAHTAPHAPHSHAQSPVHAVALPRTHSKTVRADPAPSHVTHAHSECLPATNSSQNDPPCVTCAGF